MALKLPFLFAIILFLVTFFVKSDNCNNLPLNVPDVTIQEIQEKRQNRRLQEHPFYDWYDTSTSLETRNGHWPNLTCPLGTYREFGNVALRIPGGLRLEGCIGCPPGRYGSSIYLTNANCTAPCPKGTYRTLARATSQEDCIPCPRGTYGEEEGLTSDKCSGKCSDQNTAKIKFYGDSVGLDSKEKCRPCPPGYANRQCNYLGPFVSSSRESTYEASEKLFQEEIAYFRQYQKQRRK